MPDDDAKPRNPFVRFKHHVDANISAGFKALGFSSRSSSRNSHAISVSSPAFQSFDGDGTSPSPGFSASEMSQNGSAIAVSAIAPLPENQQPVAAPEHAQIDGLYGRSRDMASAAWSLFLRRSPYSPLVLQDEANSTGSWSPRPRDLEAQVDQIERTTGARYANGWADAFEDLLRVQSARPMLGIQTLHIAPFLFWQPRQQAALGSWSVPLMVGGYRPGLALGRHTQHATSWLYPLMQHGLDEVWIPISEPGYQSPTTLGEWSAWRQREAQDQDRPGLTMCPADIAKQRFEQAVWESCQQLESVAAKLLGIDSNRDDAAKQASNLRQLVETVAREVQQDLIDIVAENFSGRVSSNVSDHEDAINQGPHTEQAQAPKLSSRLSMLGSAMWSYGDKVQKIQDAFQETRRARAAIEEHVPCLANGSNVNSKDPATEDLLYEQRTLLRRMEAAEQKLETAMRDMIELPSLDDDPPFLAAEELTETTENGGQVNKYVDKRVFVDAWGNEHTRLMTTWESADGATVRDTMRYSVRKRADDDAVGKRTDMAWSKRDDSKGARPEDQRREPPRKGGWLWN